MKTPARGRALWGCMAQRLGFLIRRTPSAHLQSIFFMCLFSCPKVCLKRLIFSKDAPFGRRAVVRYYIQLYLKQVRLKIGEPI